MLSTATRFTETIPCREGISKSCDASSPAKGGKRVKYDREGDRVVNLIVFVLWHVLPLEAMAAHFLVSWSHLEAGRVWPTLNYPRNRAIICEPAKLGGFQMDKLSSSPGYG